MRRTALSSLSLNPNCTTCLLYHFHSVASLSLPLFIWTGKIIIVSGSKNCYEGGLVHIHVQEPAWCLVFSILAVSLLLLSSSSQSSLFLMPSTGYLRGIGESHRAP